jgi:hypothetical protein
MAPWGREQGREDDKQVYLVPKHQKEGEDDYIIATEITVGGGNQHHTHDVYLQLLHMSCSTFHIISFIFLYKKI